MFIHGDLPFPRAASRETLSPQGKRRDSQLCESSMGHSKSDYYKPGETRDRRARDDAIRFLISQHFIPFRTHSEETCHL